MTNVCWSPLLHVNYARHLTMDRLSGCLGATRFEYFESDCIGIAYSAKRSRSIDCIIILIFVCVRARQTLATRSVLFTHVRCTRDHLSSLNLRSRCHQTPYRLRNSFKHKSNQLRKHQLYIYVYKKNNPNK